MLTDILSWLTALGPVGLLVLAFLDSALIPMPNGVDALLIALATTDPSSAYLGAGFATLGSLAGSLVLYSIARRGGQAVLERRGPSERMERVRRQIQKFDAFALILPTMFPLPLPMKPFVLAAGAFEMNWIRFATVILFARTVRYFGEAYLGTRYGAETSVFLKEHTGIAILVAVVVVAIFFGVHRWTTRSDRAQRPDGQRS